MDPTSSQRSALLQNYASAFIGLEDHYREHGEAEKAEAIGKIDNKFILSLITRYIQTRVYISVQIEDSCLLSKYNFPTPIKEAVERFLCANGWPNETPDEVWELIHQIHQN